MDEWTFIWQKDHISLNDWYAGLHWTKRVKAKRDWTFMFLTMLRKYKPFKLEAYEIELQFNSRLDTCNTIPMIKLFEDFLVKAAIIPDDTKKYSKKITLQPRLDLPKSTYKLILKRCV